MARMIPPGIYQPDNVSPGEREIIQRLRADPKTTDWIVLHSFDVANHETQVAGEIDFVVIVPQKGVLCVEVKAHRRIRRIDGEWFFGNDPKPDRRGPFKQASSAMHSIRKRIHEQMPELKNIVYWSAVVFPYVPFKQQSEEWHSWQLIDNDLFRSAPLSSLLADVLDTARSFLPSRPTASWFDSRNNAPNLGQCQAIADALRKDFEFFESPRSRASSLEEELKRYTTEQFEALDAMETNSRVAFFGPAGTGKTLLAVETARRSSAIGRKVLFLCYNRLLAKHLEPSIAPLQHKVHLTTLHRHMMDVAGLQIPGNSPNFWEDELPNRAIDKLLDAEDDSFIYDDLVIDEAQDILRNTYLDFLDLSLRGGLSSGRWRMFGDFEKQAIYTAADMDINDVLTTRTENAPIYSLRVNCRNTPRVAEFVHLLGGLDPRYSRILRPDDRVEPNMEFYSSATEQNERLVTILEDLYCKGFKGSDIVVLSPRGGSNSAASTIVESPWRERLRPLEQAGKGYIGYSSIHAFKGLEAPAIIVTDIEHIGDNNAMSLFYIGVTRALSRLILLMHEQVKPDMLHSLHNLSNNLDDA